VRDDDVRSACFAALDVLQAKWGLDVRYAALAAGFNFRGRRVPFLNRACGIYRAAVGPAALSVNSSRNRSGIRTSKRLMACSIATKATIRRTTSIAGCGARTFSTCRSSSSSAHVRTGTGRSIPPLSSGTSRPSYASS
jgi:hypothetical protein